jgi:hypothetical protein
MIFALEQNEKIVLIVRKHWFALITRLFPLIPFIFIPIILFIFVETVHVDLGNFTPSLEISTYESIPPENVPDISVTPINEDPRQISLGIIALFSWFLLVWISAFIIWTDYFLDVLIVTDKRIINIEQKGLFARETASLRLDKIQDITIDISGILATFLSFGNIRIQTAGEQEEFMIRFIRNPEMLKNSILKEHDRVVEALREVRIAKE